MKKIQKISSIDNPPRYPKSNHTSKGFEEILHDEIVKIKRKNFSIQEGK